MKPLPKYSIKPFMNEGAKELSNQILFIRQFKKCKEKLQFPIRDLAIFFLKKIFSFLFNY